MSLSATALVMLYAADVRAERAIVAEVAAVAPFDAEQLTAAIRLRVPREGVPVEVHVSATPDGVRIEARGNAREVALRGLTGAAAARFVALAADDLLVDDLAIAPTPRARAGGLTFGVLGGAALWPSALGSLGFDLAVPAGRALFALDAGAATLVDGPVRLTAGTVRVSAGMRFDDWFELRAGATLQPVLVSDGGGDRTVLAGAGASARLRFPLGGGVRIVFAGGADAFATRTTYVEGGMTVLATPRVAPWFAAGLEVAP